MKHSYTTLKQQILDLSDDYQNKVFLKQKCRTRHGGILTLCN